jgi:hypothetical protein
MAEVFAKDGISQSLSPVWRTGSMLPVLDFSIESLKPVDGYLGAMREKAMPKRRLTSLFGGGKPAWETIFEAEGATDALSHIAAYVGEVIRRNSKGEGVWMDFNEIQKFGGHAAEIASDENDIITSMNLVRGDSVSWPVSKVLKRIMDGPGDDVHFYAVALVQK